MTVARTTTYQVPAENVADFLALAPAAKQAIEGLGGSNFRVYRVGTGGPNTGSFITVIEFKSQKALGRFLDKSPGDPAFAAVAAQAVGLSGSPASSTLVEVDIV